MHFIKKAFVTVVLTAISPHILWAHEINTSPTLKQMTESELLVSMGYSSYKSKDYAFALDAWSRSAILGNPKAMLNLGTWYFVVAEDYGESMHWLLHAADRGELLAFQKIGLAYRRGYGVDQDNSEALRWYSRASRLGDGGSALMAGYIYRDSSITQYNLEESTQYFKRAAELGDADGMAEYGHALAYGIGISQDQTESILWYNKGVSKNSLLATRYLAIALFDGNGISSDQVESARLLQKAASGNDATSMYLLGLMRYYGTGTPRNVELASENFSQAAELGHDGASRALVAIKAGQPLEITLP